MISQQIANSGLMGAIFGSLLVTLPAITPQAKALDPCPGIYYEEPFNTIATPPEGCPPNAASQDAATQAIPSAPTDVQGTTPEPSIPGEPSYTVTPPPEERSDPIANIALSEGTVDVKLMNMTNIPVNYEAIGFTQRRLLQGGEEVVLEDLPVPVTLTAVREDEGLLKLMATAESGMLEVTLQEDPTFDDTQGVLRIQEDGQVFVN